MTNLLDDFIKKVVNLNSTIKFSIYEINSFLIKNQTLKKNKVTLIEYAAYFGSIQIINYLKSKGVKITPSLLTYSIHSHNTELVKLLENDSNITFSEGSEKVDKNTYKNCFYESIKCHWNEYGNYLLSKYQPEEPDEVLNQIIKNYNFVFMEKENLNESSFIHLCHYDYYSLVNDLLKNADIDVNMKLHNKTALFVSIENENTAIVKLLLNNEKIDVNIIHKLSYFKETALYLSIENDNIEITELLINNKNIDVNIINKNHIHKSKNNFINSIHYEETELFLAIRKEDIKIIKLLLSNDKIDINIINKENIDNEKIERSGGIGCYSYERTALHLAVEKESIEIIKLLLNNDKIDINALNYESVYRFFVGDYIHKTALYLAVENENYEIIKLLLNEDRIDLNILNLFTSADESNKIIKTKKTVLFHAVEKENVEMISLLLNHVKTDVNALNHESELDRIANDETPMGEYNKKMENISRSTQTALYLAIEKGNIEIVKLLLQKDGIDVNTFNTFRSYMHGIYIFENQLKFDSYFGRLMSKQEAIKLEDVGENIRNSKTALCLAIEKENIEIIKLLLSSDLLDINRISVVNFIDKSIVQEKTGLNMAIEKENIEIIKLLLSNEKTDINVINYVLLKNENKKLRKSALFFAIEKENIEIIKLLLNVDNIDVNIASNYIIQIGRGRWRYYDKTALYLAIEKDNIEIINLLLSNDKLNVNSFNIEIEGNQKEKQAMLIKTALYLATEKENVEIINRLLSNDKIDVSKTCVEIVLDIDRQKTLKFLTKNVVELVSEKENEKIIKLFQEKRGIDFEAMNEKEEKNVQQDLAASNTIFNELKQFLDKTDFK